MRPSENQPVPRRGALSPAGTDQLDSQPLRRLRVVLLYRGEPLEERSFLLSEHRLLSRRPTRITLGQEGTDTFPIPAHGGLPPAFPLLRSVGDEFVLRVTHSMGGRLCISGDSMSVAEFFAARRGVSVSGEAEPQREQVLGAEDWGVLTAEPTGAIAFFFQFLPPLDEVTDLRPRGRLAGMPFLRDPFLRHAVAFSAIVHLSILLLAQLAWDRGPQLALDARQAERYVRIAFDARASTLAAPKAVMDRRGGSGLASQLLLQQERRRSAPRPLLSDDTAIAATARRGPAPTRPSAPLPPTEVAPPEPGPPQRPAPRPLVPNLAASKPLVLAGPPPIAAPAPRLAVLSGAPVSHGALSAAQVDKSVTYHQREIEDCYRAESARGPAPTGRLVLTWSIDATGHVSQVRVESSTLQHQALERCVVARAEMWRFPAAAAPTPAASMPFVFRSTP